jgi:hypothetical protein
MSPKGPYDKSLVPRMAPLGGGRTFKRWGLVGGHWEQRGLWGTVSSFFFSLSGHEVNSYPLSHAPTLIFYLTTGPKTMGPPIIG